MADRRIFLDREGLELYDLLLKQYIGKNSDATQEVIESIQELLAANTEAIAANTEAVEAAQSAIDILNGDKDTEGSVAKSVNDAIQELLDGAPEAFDTLKEISDWISNDETGTAALIEKVDTIEDNVENLKTYVDNQDDYYYNLVGSISDVSIAGLFPVKQTSDKSVNEAIADLEEGKAVQLLADQTIDADIEITKSCFIDANGSTFTGTVTVPADAEVVIENAVFTTPVVVK